jgi:hypothetical protein
MPQIDEPVSPAPKTAPEVKKPKTTASAKPPPGLFAFTVDTSNGRIVMVEKVEGSTRHVLSPEERAKIAKDNGAPPLRRLVEQAFEAGIDFVLGDSGDGEITASRQDDELSGMLLKTLIEGSQMRELVSGDALDRAIVSTLFGHAAKSAGPVSH